MWIRRLRKRQSERGQRRHNHRRADPSEYAAGHLQSAKNVDVESADFDAQIAALPKGDAYVVYCRSAIAALPL